MATKVKHGADPDFRDVPIQPGSEFSCVVRGFYTDDPKLGAGGVLAVSFNSERPEKQVNELLVLRSCFRHWYEQEMRARGVEPTGEYAL